MQLILVILILAGCVTYTARRLWKRFTTKRKEGDMRCAGCPLADNCHHLEARDCERNSEHKGCCCH